MKEKPLIERIVPGIALQVQKKGDDLMVDFNAYAGYRFTGRITAGLGWNQRVASTLIRINLIQMQEYLALAHLVNLSSGKDFHLELNSK